MIPSLFIVLESLPRTANGKLDRHALPNPFGASTPAQPREFTPARTATQRTIAAIWRELLQTDRIDITETFFNLGGHSLLSLRAAASMERALGVRVRVRAFFTQSLEQIAAMADRSNGHAAPDGDHPAEPAP
jgi:hypothetical protein